MTTSGEKYMDEVIPPIPVQVINQPSAPAIPREPEEVTFTTLILTATDPVQQVAPVDPQRCECQILQAGDNDIVVAASKGEAQSASNSTALLPNPSGLIVIKTFLNPVVIKTQGRILVTAQAFPTRVGVIITRRITGQ